MSPLNHTWIRPINDSNTFNFTLPPFEGPTWADNVHEMIVITLCLLGIPAHTCIILTLTRADFWNASNALMVSLSGTQIGVLSTFLYSTIFLGLLKRSCIGLFWTKGAVVTLLVCVNLTLLFHTAAVFHVIAITVVRYITIQFFAQRTGGQNWFSLFRAKATCAFVLCMTTALCVPFFLNSEVQEDIQVTMIQWQYCPNMAGQRAYVLKYSQFALETGLLLFNFWFFSIIGKLVPCFVLIICSCLLVVKLLEFEQKAKHINRRSVRNYRFTTYFILTIAVLFIMVELPQGILNLLSGILGSEFNAKVYTKRVGDIFEMLVVMYSSVNFLLYCCMNGQFRAHMHTSLTQTANWVTGDRYEKRFLPWWRPIWRRIRCKNKAEAQNGTAVTNGEGCRRSTRHAVATKSAVNMAGVVDKDLHGDIELLQLRLPTEVQEQIERLQLDDSSSAEQSINLLGCPNNNNKNEADRKRGRSFVRPKKRVKHEPENLIPINRYSLYELRTDRTSV